MNLKLKLKVVDDIAKRHSSVALREVFRSNNFQPIKISLLTMALLNFVAEVNYMMIFLQSKSLKR